MTATKGKPSRRFSREQQQENRSRAEFEARLSEPEIGWIPSTVKTDMGEDLHIRIYDKGVSTGLSFDVQLKSAADSAKLKKRKTASLAYKLEVKDLLHWEVSTTLVVLVVWDVEKRAGWWRSIPEIIKELDAGSKTWREQKTIAVSIPLANGTDKDGLRALRWTVADHALPLLAPKESTLKLHFPRTEEGEASLAAFRRAFDDDEEVELGGGELIAPKLEYPAWHQRIYGDFDGTARLAIGRSRSDFMLPVRVDLESSQATASLPYVELRPDKWGRRKKVLSNHQQDLPIELWIDFEDGRGSARLELVRRGKDVFEAQETVTFALLLAQEKVSCRLTALTSERPTIEFKLDDPSDETTIAKLEEWHKFVDKLAYIQSRTSPQRILVPEGAIPIAEVIAAERVFTILSQGTERKSISKSVVVSGTAAHVNEQLALWQRMSRGKSNFSIGVGKSEPIRFFNVEFDPGTYYVVPVKTSEFFAQWDLQIRQAPRRLKRRIVKLENLPVTYDYIAWTPEETRWDRLSQLAVQQAGYVVLPQVRRFGYTDDTFDANIRSGKVEQVASGVFYLKHFPRFDREELIVAWLQSYMTGVLSHDTALVLNELSDILPRRRHVTVPPGWSPGNRQLDADIVLHYADVNEDEIRWLGPVPYTAPLRTVRDCIAAHLPPDLIEQAIGDGLRLGMFTEADVMPDTSRGAA